MNTVENFEKAKIWHCRKTDCHYNGDDGKCHASGIHIGSAEPVCETYSAQPGRTNMDNVGEVGICTIKSCVFNNDMTCIAKGLHMTETDSTAFCGTFRTAI